MLVKIKGKHMCMTLFFYEFFQMKNFKTVMFLVYDAAAYVRGFSFKPSSLQGTHMHLKWKMLWKR